MEQLTDFTNQSASQMKAIPLEHRVYKEISLSLPMTWMVNVFRNEFSENSWDELWIPGLFLWDI